MAQKHADPADPDPQHWINPHKNGPFDALMQNGQKYAVSLQCLLSMQ
jgi:hypothetical protein